MIENIIITVANMLVDFTAMILCFCALAWQYQFMNGIKKGYIKKEDVHVNDIGLSNITRNRVLFGNLCLFVVFFSYNLTKCVSNFPRFGSEMQKYTSIITSGIVLYLAINIFKIYKSLRKYL